DCFFFQAEDGIRDFHVTGVQTCALPIYGAAPPGQAVHELEIEPSTSQELRAELPAPLGAEAREVRLALGEGRDTTEGAVSARAITPVPGREVHLRAVRQLLPVGDVIALEMQGAALRDPPGQIAARLRPLLHVPRQQRGRERAEPAGAAPARGGPPPAAARGRRPPRRAPRPPPPAGARGRGRPGPRRGRGGERGGGNSKCKMSG